MAKKTQELIEAEETRLSELKKKLQEAKKEVQNCEKKIASLRKQAQSEKLELLAQLASKKDISVEILLKAIENEDIVSLIAETKADESSAQSSSNEESLATVSADVEAVTDDDDDEDIEDTKEKQDSAWQLTKSTTSVTYFSPISFELAGLPQAVLPFQRKICNHFRSTGK